MQTQNIQSPRSITSMPFNNENKIMKAVSATKQFQQQQTKFNYRRRRRKTNTNAQREEEEI